jgi:hypothetical protein
MSDVEANKALVKRFLDALVAVMSRPPLRASTRALLLPHLGG